MAKKTKKSKKKLYRVEYEEVSHGISLVWADNEENAFDKVQEYIMDEIEYISSEKVNKKELDLYGDLINPEDEPK